jgi:hypothetical protein
VAVMHHRLPMEEIKAREMHVVKDKIGKEIDRDGKDNFKIGHSHRSNVTPIQSTSHLYIMRKDGRIASLRYTMASS